MAKRRMLWLDGMEDVLEELDEIGRLAPGAVREALEESGKIVRDDASGLAPIGPTGELSKNIILEVDTKKLSVRIGPSSKVWYGKFPELGTKFQAAQPYLRPALDSRRKDVRDAFIVELEKAIKRALR